MLVSEHLIQSFPRLEIVSRDSLLVYEKFDPVRIAHLTKKISADNQFIQPIIVGEEPGTGRRIVLDGVNRMQVLKQLGAKDVVAHVVNYFDTKEVNLLYNHHYFFVENSQVIERLRAIPHMVLEPISSEAASAGVETGHLQGYLRVGSTYYSFGPHTYIKDTIRLLNSVVDSYLGQTDFCRHSEADMSKAGVPMEIVFRRFTPAEIVELSVSNQMLNSGITRHVVSVYCLGLHIPLSLLLSPAPIEEKNGQLKTMLYNLIVERGYRYYPSPIYKFDEKE